MSKPKTQRRKEDRPSEIIEAGIAEFAEHGFERARLDRIAKAAGIAKGTIYLYYDSKEALFLAAADEHVVRVMAEGEMRLETSEGSTEEMLIQLLESFYRQVSDSPARTLMRILIAEGDRIPQVVERYHDMAIQRGTLLLRGILERGIARGEVRDTAVLDHPQVLISPAIFFVIHGLLFGDRMQIDRETFFKAHVALVLHGVLKE